MLRNILVLRDGSPLSERALPYAAELARADGPSMTLVRAGDVHPGLQLGLTCSRRTHRGISTCTETRYGHRDWWWTRRERRASHRTCWSPRSSATSRTPHVRRGDQGRCRVETWFYVESPGATGVLPRLLASSRYQRSSISPRTPRNREVLPGSRPPRIDRSE